MYFRASSNAAGLYRAQMGMHAAPAMRGIFNPVVGSGGQYEMTTEKGTKMVMEIAVVGKESVDGKEGYWFEMTMSTPHHGADDYQKLDGSRRARTPSPPA